MLGVISFGVLVPTFFIPSDLGSSSHLLSILVATLTSFTIWEGSKLVQAYIAFLFPWENSIKRRLTFEILSIFILSTGALLIGIFSYGHIASALTITTTIILRNIFVSFLLALLFTAINEGTYLFNAWKTSLIEKEQLKKEAVEAKLESLKKQLDPHFLFNSLSVLSEVVHQDISLADEFISRLSQVYRYVIEYNDTKEVKVKDELLFTEAYFFLLKVRFQDKIKLSIEKDLEFLKGKLLPLTLQLLVENAVKHNKMVLPLELKIYHENDMIWVKNNLQKRTSPKNSTGLGLTNLSKRSLLLTRHDIKIVETTETFKVGIPLISK